MNIGQKIKDAWKKLTSRRDGKNNKDAELGADEVLHEEVFPKKAKKPAAVKSKKPASKRTRPTNNNYTMINPDDDGPDTGKS